MSRAYTAESTNTVTARKTPTRDQTFDVLSHRRRRYALHYLTREDRPVELGELAEQLAAWEDGDKPIDAVSSTERKRVYTALQQSHLPVMDRAGVVEFDKRAGVVALTGGSEDVDIYLDIVEEKDIPWSEYYLGLSGIGVVLMAGAWLDIYPLTLLPDVAWGTFLATAFVLSAIAHFVLGRRSKVGVQDVPPEVSYSRSNTPSEQSFADEGV